MLLFANSNKPNDLYKQLEHPVKFKYSKKGWDFNYYINPQSNLTNAIKKYI